MLSFQAHRADGGQQTVTVQKVSIIITFGDLVKFNFQPNMDIHHTHTQHVFQ